MARLAAHVLVLVRAAVLSGLPWSASASSGEMQLVSLSDRHPEAVCNDGTPAGYYFRKAASVNGSRTWIVYLESGGWCWDLASCDDRCTWGNGHYCSSAPWEPSLELGGIMSSSNDDYHVSLRTANKVFVRYCTSDAHMGNTEAFGRQFRGHRVVQAVLSDLVATHGLGSNGPGEQGKHLVIFGGGSAGARGAMVHLDYVPAMLGSVAANVDVVGFLDSPLWLDMGSLNMTNFPGFGEQTAHVHSFTNVTHFGETCAAAYPDELWKCMLGQYRMSHLQSRYVVVAALHDSFQLDNLAQGQLETEAGMDLAVRFANQTAIALRRLHGRGHVLFGSACHSHAESLSDEGFFGHSTADGRTQSAVLQAFLGLGELPADSIDCIDDCLNFDCGVGCHSEQEGIHNVNAARPRSLHVPLAGLAALFAVRALA